MARPLRIEFEGAVYHLAARGNERRKIFFSKRDYERFKEYIAEAKGKPMGSGLTFCYLQNVEQGYSSARKGWATTSGGSA